MDPVTHTLLGVNLAGAAGRGRAVAMVVTVASLLPDVDVLWSFAGVATATLERRTLTHSVAGLPLLCLLAALLLKRWLPRWSWRELFGWCLLGGVVHVLFDLVNSYGVALLAPFSSRRFELALVFPVDLVVLAVLVVPAIVWARRRRPTVTGARLALGLVAVYLAFCALARDTAGKSLESWAACQPDPAELTYVVPEPLGPRSWTGLVRSPGDVYRVTLVDALAGRVEPRRTVVSMATDPRVASVLADPEGRRVAAFLRVPVWRAEGNTVTAQDLRFSYQRLGNTWDPFRFRFRLDGDGIRLEEWSAGEVGDGILRVLGDGA